jgi:FMN-dependent NADH-azoreductase
MSAPATKSIDERKFPMTNLLVLSTSISGSGLSDELLQGYVSAVRTQNPGLNVTWRGLGTNPPPHLTAARLPGLAGNTDTPDSRDTLALSDEFIAEFRAADTILIGSPMYNFGVSTALKSWFDHVLRAGVTFHYTPEGPVGHLTGRRAIVVETRGGFFSAGPMHEKDSQESHIRTMFWFVGITDVTFVRAERLGMGPEIAAAAADQAAVELAALAGMPLQIAA